MAETTECPHCAETMLVTKGDGSSALVAGTSRLKSIPRTDVVAQSA